MKLPIYQLDAFAGAVFAGNPAAVCPLTEWLPDKTMQAIAAENNLAETAFFVGDKGKYAIRWFTPTVEVPLCGHATLASAAVIMERLEPGLSKVVFDSASGPLTVNRTETGYIVDLPARPSAPVAPPPGLAEALGAVPVEVFGNAFNYMALLESAQAVRALAPDMAAVARMDRSGVIVTAPGDGSHDFVSRYFAPAKGIPEDPVTGGAHCTLTPYWAGRLGKSKLNARQVSPRGGELAVELKGDRVAIGGRVAAYMEGTIHV